MLRSGVHPLAAPDNRDGSQGKDRLLWTLSARVESVWVAVWAGKEIHGFGVRSQAPRGSLAVGQSPRGLPPPLRCRQRSRAQAASIQAKGERSSRLKLCVLALNGEAVWNLEEKAVSGV